MTNSWTEALAGFDTELRRRRRRHSTISSYRCHLRGLAAVAPDGPASLDVVTAAAWSLDHSPTANRVARMFYGWAVAAGFVAASPFAAPERRDDRLRSPADLEDFPDPWVEPVGRLVTRARAEGLSARTVALWLHYLRDLARIQPFPWLVDTDALARWLDRDGWSAETKASARTAVRRFYRLAVDAGYLEASPAAGLGAVRVPRGAPRPTTQDAFTTALRVADDRQRLMLVLAAYAGLRAREIASVRPATDMLDGVLYVRGKGGHERRVPIHPVIAAEVAAEVERRRRGQLGSGFRYYAEVAADGWLFPGQSGGPVQPGSVTRVLSRLLGGQWTAHTLRHRFASQTYEACRDIRAVQELLGHSSPVTTARYTAVSDATKVNAVLGLR